MSMEIDFGVNQAIVEELYLRYCENRLSVDESWRVYFDAMPPMERTIGGTILSPFVPEPASEPPAVNGNGKYTNGAHTMSPSIAPVASRTPAPGRPAANGNSEGSGRYSDVTTFVYPDEVTNAWSIPFLSEPPNELTEATFHQARVSGMIAAYRSRGHLFAQLDPLGLIPRPPDELSLETFGLAHVDPNAEFNCELGGAVRLPLSEIVARLESTYCRSIGVEFTFIENPDERAWLQEQMESTGNRLDLSREEQLVVLEKLTDAELLETFIHTNYVNAKRFSVEGGESVIPLLDLLINYAGHLGVDDIVLGMAHRGRLNVLANILNKSLHEIFFHFEDKHPELNLGRGDVKYHLGYSSDRILSDGKKVHLSLAFNPSHLEFVNPVVTGRVRAKQDRQGDTTRLRGLPLLIHGDAAFIGQGVVAETLNLSLLEGYCTGGTIHVVINNQVGFTTLPEDARSSRYSTDITRMLRCPVFHVNGEDPEAVAQVARLAAEYRQRYAKDVVIDMYCYRKYGHNEADEPRYTQPVMYAAIDKKPTVREVYVRHLVATGKIDAATADRVAAERRAELEAALEQARKGNFVPPEYAFGGVWNSYRGGFDVDCPDVDTAVPATDLIHLLGRITMLPSTFNVNKGVLRTVIEKRMKASEPAAMLDWGCAEHLAFASLLAEGVPIRLSGQDSRRGTFSHRHAVLYDSETGVRYTPLNNISPNQGRFDVFDSSLSEQGVLGFEYGYSLDRPDALVIWEAQFGDFANGAQVIIDQFISSGEDKWQRLSGMVLLLPHGFEGQGPEHSSARLERFLALAAEDNIQVVNLTSASQIFHCLRRQARRKWRKPLIVMSPKSLLRDARAMSPLEALANGTFQRIIPDSSEIEHKKVKRLILCSGKVYYDLVAAREAANTKNTHIVRFEQLYPLRAKDLEQLLARYGKNTEIVWVQEEPENNGAWYYINSKLPRHLGGRPLRCVSRVESASPATGSFASHKVEQKQLMDAAFA